MNPENTSEIHSTYIIHILGIQNGNNVFVYRIYTLWKANTAEGYDRSYRVPMLCEIT